MNKTLEQLNIAMTEEYWPARAAKVASIATYLADFIKPELSAEGLAEHFMDLAECNGQISGNDVSGEVPASFSLDGNANSFVV